MAGMAPPPLEEEPEEGAATPEEQETYEEFVLAGDLLIFENKKVRPGIAKMLDEDPSDLMGVLGNVEELQQFGPTVAVAATAAIVALEIVRRAKDEGVEIDGEIVLNAGAEIVELLAEIKGKISKKPLTEDELNQAMMMAADLYREAGSQAGVVDEEALKAQFDEVVKADKEGRLGEVAPELQKLNEIAAADAEAAASEEAE